VPPQAAAKRSPEQQAPKQDTQYEIDVPGWMHVGDLR